MKNIFLLIALLIFLSTTSHAFIETVTVSGHVFLEGQTNHSGTKIVFYPFVPSAALDSTYTISDGSFAAEIEIGKYEVVFTHSGFLEYTYPGHPIFSTDSIIDTVTMHPGNTKHLSGSVSGTWYSDTTYLVMGNITLNNGDTLIIEPGTRIEFNEGYNLSNRSFVKYDFNIYGFIRAVGSENDSIIFTPHHQPFIPGDVGMISFACNAHNK